MSNKKSKAAQEKHAEQRALLKEQQEKALQAKKQEALEKQKQSQPVVAKRECAVPATAQSAQKSEVTEKPTVAATICQSQPETKCPQTTPVEPKAAEPAKVEVKEIKPAKVEAKDVKPLAAEPKVEAKEVKPLAAEPKVEAKEVKLAKVEAKEVKPLAVESKTVATAKPAKSPEPCRTEPAATPAAVCSCAAVDKAAVQAEPTARPSVQAPVVAVAQPEKKSVQANPDGSFFWFKFMAGIAVGLLTLFAIDFAVDMYERIGKLEDGSGKTVPSGDPAGKKLVELERNWQGLANIVYGSQQDLERKVALEVEKKVAKLETGLQKLEELVAKTPTQPQPQTTAAVNTQEFEKKLAMLESGVQKLQEIVSKPVVQPQDQTAVAQLLAVQQEVAALKKELEGKRLKDAEDLKRTWQEEQKANLLMTDVLRKDVDVLARNMENKTTDLQTRLDQFKDLLAKGQNQAPITTETLKISAQDLQNLNLRLGVIETESKQSVATLQRQIEQLDKDLVSKLALGEQYTKQTVQAIQGQIEFVQKDFTTLQGQAKIADNSLKLLEEKSQSVDKHIQESTATSRKLEQTLGELDQKLVNVDQKTQPVPTLYAKLDNVEKQMQENGKSLDQKLGNVEQKIQTVQDNLASQVTRLEGMVKSVPKSETAQPQPTTASGLSDHSVASQHLSVELQKLLTASIKSNLPGTKVTFGKNGLVLLNPEANVKELEATLEFSEDLFVEQPVILAIVEGRPEWNTQIKSLTNKNAVLTVKRSAGIKEDETYVLWWIAIGKGN